MAYITLNNFQVAEDQAEGFEQRWRQRRSRLQGVSGFESFRLLRGEASESAVHYASHTTWASKEAFEAWMHSDHFVQVHRGDPLPKGMVLSPPPPANASTSYWKPEPGAGCCRRVTPTANPRLLEAANPHKIQSDTEML